MLPMFGTAGRHRCDIQDLIESCSVVSHCVSSCISYAKVASSPDWFDSVSAMGQRRECRGQGLHSEAKKVSFTPEVRPCLVCARVL